MPILKACSKCARPFDPTTAKWPKRFCPAHEPTRADRSPTTRAQDSTYRRNRKVVLERDPTCTIKTHCSGAPSTCVDHVVPVSAGGTHDLENLRGSCDTCNQAKGGKVAQGTYTPPTPPHRATKLR